MIFTLSKTYIIGYHQSSQWSLSLQHTVTMNLPCVHWEPLPAPQTAKNSPSGTSNDPQYHPTISSDTLDQFPDLQDKIQNLTGFCIKYTTYWVYTSVYFTNLNYEISKTHFLMTWDSCMKTVLNFYGETKEFQSFQTNRQPLQYNTFKDE